MSKTPSNKTDIHLGSAVAAKLVELGLETPMATDPAPTPFEAQPAIEGHIQRILEIMGLDLKDDSLRDTPKRVAKMFRTELFWGLDYANFPKATVIDNKMGYDQMILERNITVQSTCEHHLLPIIGRAHIAYIPAKKVLGLSKLNRITEFFSRRPQVQERLTAQISECLKKVLETEDVAVLIEAEHMCVRTRGVEDACSDTVTTQLSGAFRDGICRQEFLASIALKR